MARDRLLELLQRSDSIVSASTGGSMSSLTNGSNNELHRNAIDMHSSPIDDILVPYTEIRANLAHIADNLDAMNRMVQIINIRNFNENEMEELRNVNLKIGNQLMNKFRDFKANLPAEDDYKLEARIKRTLFYGLYQSYINIWNKNEEFLQYYERKLKKNLHLHTKIINSNATEDEIEELIANKTTNLFVGNILEETEKERRTLRDLIDRFNELKKLEKSIADVNALFLRIQTLVLEQSDTIQRVEFHAQQATLFVDKGTDELEQADRLHKKSLKKKCILIAVSIIVVVVILFIILYF